MNVQVVVLLFCRGLGQLQSFQHQPLLILRAQHGTDRNATALIETNERLVKKRIQRSTEQQSIVSVQPFRVVRASPRLDVRSTKDLAGLTFMYCALAAPDFFHIATKLALSPPG